MAQFYFRYSTMNAGKSIDILKVAYNYYEQGKLALIFSSDKDQRFGVGYVASRIGIKEKAIMYSAETNIYKMIKFFTDKGRKIDAILIDESQFLKRDQVIQLSKVVDDLNIPVIAYGLRTDFQAELFEGSHALFCEADKIEELKTICWFCKHKATRNLRVKNGVPLFEGKQIVIGENADKAEASQDVIAYFPVCRSCMNKMKISGKLPVVKQKNKNENEDLIWEDYEEYQTIDV
jgi:thymidine kinase